MLSKGHYIHFTLTTEVIVNAALRKHKPCFSFGGHVDCPETRSHQAGEYALTNRSFLKTLSVYKLEQGQEVNTV